jgi:hypothetical protein
MSDSESLPFGAGVAATVLEILHLPGATAIMKITEAALDKKRRETAEILIEEIKKGRHGEINFDEHDVDPLIDIILRFSKAVSEGAAKANLRLLAQVIAGLKKNRALESDRFRRWASILEDMTRDELVAVGLAYRIAKTSKPGPDSTFSHDLHEALHAKFGEETAGLLAAVSRTGLLAPVSAFGGLAYFPTPWLQQLGELADLERPVMSV